MSLHPPMAASELRTLIESTILHASDLDAFLGDFFPEVSRRLTNGMDRTERINLLLTAYQGRFEEVAARLNERFPRPEPAPSRGAEAEGDKVRRRVLLEHQTEALDLDRYRQWHELLVRSRRPGHELIFLPGERGQGHVYFVMRVELSLPNDPPRTVVSVSWSRQPVPPTRKDLLSDLAKALGCGSEPAALRAELHRRLAQRNLILLHPLLREGFEEKALSLYYSEWLPELLGEITGSFSAKIIQPVEWAVAGAPARLAALLLGWLYSEPRPWLRRVRQARRARTFMTDLAERKSAALPISALPDLDRIERAHILDFCRLVQLPESRRDEFVDAVLSGARTASDILQNIGDYLPQYRPGP